MMSSKQGLLKPAQYGWLWSISVVLVTYLGALALLLDLPQTPRNVLLVLFFSYAPGGALGLAFRLDEMFPFIPVAFMLSLSIVVLVSETLLYLGLWQYDLGIPILMAISLLGASVRLLQGLIRYLWKRK